MKLNKTDLPRGWEIVKLGNVCKTFSGGTPSVKEAKNYKHGRIPFIRSAEIHSTQTKLFLTDLGLKNSSAKIVEVGDLLFALYGANSGDIDISKINGAINQAILCIRSDSLNIYYLKNIFLNNKNRLLNVYLQGGQGNLSAEIIKSLKIPVPPIGEQERIAELLSCWDKAIEENLKIIALKEKRKKGLIQSLLNGETKLAGHIKQISLKNSKNDISNVLSVTNSNGFINQKNQFDRVIASKDLKNYKIVKRGEFAYNPSRINVGSIDLLKNFNIGVISPIYIVFETIENRLSKHYLKHLFKSSIFYNQLSRYTQGSVRDNLGFDGLEMIKMNIPSLAEQEKIAEILSVADEDISLHRAKVELLKKQKKYLMQVLLRGKIRLKLLLKLG